MSAEPAVAVEALTRDESRPLHWVETDADLIDMCTALRAETVVGLDVETTLRTRALCLIQLGASDVTYLVDALRVADLEPLEQIFSEPSITKVIHNAAFERSVLKRYGLELEGVADTLTLSRQIRGRKAAGGHSLKAVCERELGATLDQSEQTSNWSRRPLTKSQVAYAALDAEVLLRLLVRLG